MFYNYFFVKMDPKEEKISRCVTILVSQKFNPTKREIAHLSGLEIVTILTFLVIHEFDSRNVAVHALATNRNHFCGLQCPVGLFLSDLVNHYHRGSRVETSSSVTTELRRNVLRRKKTHPTISLCGSSRSSLGLNLCFLIPWNLSEPLCTLWIPRFSWYARSNYLERNEKNMENLVFAFRWNYSSLTKPSMTRMAGFVIETPINPDTLRQWLVLQGLSRETHSRSNLNSPNVFCWPWG